MEHNHDDYGIPKYHHDCLACVKQYASREGNPEREFSRKRKPFGRRSGMATGGPIS